MTLHKLSHPTLRILSALLTVGFFCLTIGVSSRYHAAVTTSCGAAAASDTFIKTYRMRDRAEGYGLLSLKDGGYLVTGDTTLSSGMGVWNAFAVKTDAKGTALWSKQFGSQSAAQGVLTDTKRLSVQTSDGNFVLAGDIIDFYDAAYEDKKEGWGDIIVTKLTTGGNAVWSTMVGDYSMDFPQKLWAAPDGGVILLAKFKEMGHGSDIADFDAVPGYSVVIRFGAGGKVQWSKKLNFVATDMEYLQDGSFIALAELDPRAMGQTDMATGTVPTVIKLDSKLKVAWAKSIEAPPIGFATPTGTTRETMKITQTKIRVPGGDFKSVEQTPDGGFIAFGRYFNAARFLGGGGAGITHPTQPIPTVAVKVNAGGTYQWARSIQTAFGPLGTDLNTVKTSDNGFIMSRNVARKAMSTKLADFASNVEIVKTDAEFSPRWIRKIDIERDSAGYDLQATKDGGVTLGGRIITVEEHMIMGSLEPYEEALLVKADANGNVSGANVIEESTQVTVEDQSSYLIMQDMSASTEDMKLQINKAVKATVSNIEDKERTIVAHTKTTVAPVCSTLTTGGSTPKAGSTTSKAKTSKLKSGSATKTSAPAGAPQAATYPQINFDNAKEAELETEKSRQIHAELLPILEKIFGEVKMTDNTSGLWLTYYFPRQATQADREAVQKAYVALGYKVDEAEGGILNVSKVGRSLRMTFAINNAMKGKLEVML